MIEVFVDGACRGNGIDGNTGDSSLGIAIYRNGKVIGTYCRPLGKRSSSEAEYEALIHALFWCWSLSALDDDFLSPLIYTDSLALYNQVEGIWNCKSQSLLPLLAAVTKFKESGFAFTLRHVKRRVVWEADQLANMILDDVMDSKRGSKK